MISNAFFVIPQCILFFTLCMIYIYILFRNHLITPVFVTINISIRCLTFTKQTLVFTCLQYKSFEDTVGKGEIVHKEQFLLFPQCFLPIWRTFCHFHQIRNCRLQTLLVWKSLKTVVWEKVK